MKQSESDSRARMTQLGSTPVGRAWTLTKKVVLGAAVVLAAATFAGMAEYFYYLPTQIGSCHLELEPMLDLHGAPNQPIKKHDSLLRGTFNFMMHPRIGTMDGATCIYLSSHVDFYLKYKYIDYNYDQICEELKYHGIHVAERSKEGTSRGLTEFALRHMQNGVEKHYKKNCDCALNKVLSEAPLTSEAPPLSETPPTSKAPPVHKTLHTSEAHPAKGKLLESSSDCFIHYDPVTKRSTFEQCFNNVNTADNSYERSVKPSADAGNVVLQVRNYHTHDSQVKLNAALHYHVPHSIDTGYEKICDELERRGIHVMQRTEEGARLGLFEYAIKHTHDGLEKHSEKKCSCGTSPAPSKTPPTSETQSPR